MELICVSGQIAQLGFALPEAGFGPLDKGVHICRIKDAFVWLNATSLHDQMAGFACCNGFEVSKGITNKSCATASRASFSPDSMGITEATASTMAEDKLGHKDALF